MIPGQTTRTEDEDLLEASDRWKRIIQTVVTLLILTSFVGVILVTFYNQFTGKQTHLPDLPTVAYLDWDEQETLQLFMIQPFASKTPIQLTDEVNDVREFAVSPTGNTVIYAVERHDGRIDLKQFTWNGREVHNQRTLLQCPTTACEQLVWHPDGRRLIYEQRGDQGPQLWWVDTVTGETITVREASTAVSQSSALSADGRWLSFADPLDEEMVLYEFGQAQQIRLVNALGSPAVWHPTAPQFLYSDFDLIVYHGADNETAHQDHQHGFDQVIHLYLADTSGTAVTLLPETGNVNDANPAWSPDGEWIAFGRKPIGTTAGRQLWLMRRDGSDAHPLTEAATVHHGPPIWSPDGRFLLFQRFDLQDPDSKPSVWLLELSTNRLTAVVETGILPTWLP